MRITKKQVIDAILTEPLGKGFFFNLNDGPLGVIDDGRCEVCAVGAVLRSTGKKYTGSDACEITAETAASQYIDSAYENYKKDPNNFLQVLSCEFEFEDEEFGFLQDDARFHALMVAEGLCPKTLTIQNPEKRS